MLKIILNAPHIIKPFNERARDLRIQNQPLWLYQRNVLAPYVTSERELEPGKRLPLVREPTLVYRDNLQRLERKNVPYGQPFQSTIQLFVSMLSRFRHLIPLQVICS